MTVSVQAGRVSADSLQAWLNDNPFQQWISSVAQSAHALVEYVHRYAFLSWTDFLKDLSLREIAKYGLRGRIFWETGQVSWRRLKAGEFAVCLLLESNACPCLPADLKWAEEFPETLELDVDQPLLLWGTYNAHNKVFLEQRVSGSRPITYPADISRAAKDYPVVEVRIYRNEDGDPSMWRFLRPTAYRKSDWRDALEEKE